MLCIKVTGLAMLPLSTGISRHLERDADAYAIDLTRDAARFQEVLVKLAKHNLQPLDLPRWEVVLFSGHPTVRERLADAAAYDGDPESNTN